MQLQDVLKINGYFERFSGARLVVSFIGAVDDSFTTYFLSLFPYRISRCPDPTKCTLRTGGWGHNYNQFDQLAPRGLKRLSYDSQPGINFIKPGFYSEFACGLFKNIILPFCGSHSEGHFTSLCPLQHAAKVSNCQRENNNSERGFV